jgi:hypothetical protein
MGRRVTSIIAGGSVFTRITDDRKLAIVGVCGGRPFGAEVCKRGDCVRELVVAQALAPNQRAKK